MADGRHSSPLITDLDIYRTAKLLVDKHGDEAPIHAAMKVDAMLDKGDMDGRAVWLRVVRAVEELLDCKEGRVRNLH